jgi:hypothetical protein
MIFKSKPFPKARYVTRSFLRISEPSLLEVGLLKNIIVNGKFKFVFLDYEDGLVTKFFSNNKNFKTELFMYGPQCPGYGDDLELKYMLQTSFEAHIDKITIRRVKNNTEPVIRVAISGRITY